MKRKIMPLFMALPLGAYLFSHIPSHESVKVAAVDIPWVEAAVASSGESYDYQIVISPTTLVGIDANYPSIPNSDTTITTLNRSPIKMTNAYIGMTSMVRDDFMTLDTWSMVQGANNLGHIKEIIIDIDESKYANLNELGGAFGLQLRVGQDQQFSNAEDEESGPTDIDPVDYVVGWDLTIKGRQHPFFLNEAKLDNVSNFNFIATRTIYIESITINATHFMTITNHTSIRPAFELDNNWFRFSIFDINVDNRVDHATDDFVTENFDTATPHPLSDMLVFTIKFAYPYNDTGHYLKVTTMKAIVVDEGVPVLSMTPTTSPLSMQADKKNWLASLTSITYGGQDVSILPESVFDVQIFSLGYQDVVIGLWNVFEWVPAYVTNEGVNVSGATPGVTGETISGIISDNIVYGFNYSSQDFIFPEHPENNYSLFTINEINGYFGLKSEYGSIGYVDSITFTIDILGVTPKAGPGTHNRFEIVFHAANNALIDDTVRYVDILPTDTQKVIIYTDQSGFYGRSFSIHAIDRKDYVFDLKVSVQGFEFYDHLTTSSQQAIMFAESFNSITSDLQGAAMDGVCAFDLLNNWAMLNDEYTLLSQGAKDLIASNATTMQSSAVGVMIERYLYIRNTNPSQYNDFLGLGVSPSPRLVPTDGPNHLGVTALFLLVNLGLFCVMTKRKIEH